VVSESSISSPGHQPEHFSIIADALEGWGDELDDRTVD